MRLYVVKFIKKSWSKSFGDSSVKDRVGCWCICAAVSRQYNQLFYKILTEQLNLEGQKEVATSEISYPSMYQNATEGKYMFFDQKRSKPSEIYSMEPHLYPLTTDRVEVIKEFIQKHQNHSKICMSTGISKNVKSWDLLCNCRIWSRIFSTDLGHMFEMNSGKEFILMWSGTRPHDPRFAHDFVPIHSLRMYTDLIEYNSSSDTKAPLLRFSPFNSELKPEDVKTTGHYMNYQTFSTLKFRAHLKNWFHSSHID